MKFIVNLFKKIYLTVLHIELSNIEEVVEDIEEWGKDYDLCFDDEEELRTLKIREIEINHKILELEGEIN